MNYFNKELGIDLKINEPLNFYVFYKIGNLFAENKYYGLANNFTVFSSMLANYNKMYLQELNIAHELVNFIWTIPEEEYKQIWTIEKKDLVLIHLKRSAILAKQLYGENSYGLL